jgi:hypothetical protein
MKPKLTLKVDKTTNDLHIMYKNTVLFSILKDGQCWFSFNDNTLKLYTDWVKNGCPVSEKVVKWRGGKYQLDNTYKALIRIDTERGTIIILQNMEVCFYCTDDNLIRHKHNGAIVIF